MKDIRECGPTGKLAFTAEEIAKEVKRIRKADATYFICKICHKFHLVIRRRKANGLERSRE